MKKIIKSLKGGDYFVSIKRINKVNYETYWSGDKSDAMVFETTRQLNGALALLQNANDNDDEFIVLEV